jgi:hypothetical protein
MVPDEAAGTGDENAHRHIAHGPMRMSGLSARSWAHMLSKRIAALQ